MKKLLIFLSLIILMALTAAYILDYYEYLDIQGIKIHALSILKNISILSIFLSETIFRNKPSAIGLLQILPWHTNIIFFIVESPLFSDGLIITYVILLPPSLCFFFILSYLCMLMF